MRNDSSRATAGRFPTLLGHQAFKSMERAPGLERADFLVVFAFEPQSYDWFCGFVAGPWCICESGWGLGGRCESGKGVVCEDGRVVDVGCD